MRLFSLAILLAVLLTLVPGSVANATPHSFDTFGHPALEAINDAYLSGQITEGEAMLNRIYFIFSPEKMPAEFNLTGEPIKSGTPILLEAYERAEQYEPWIKDQIDATRARPYGYDDTIETEHFMIHYRLSGSYSVTEAYANDVANAAEEGYAKYHDTLTWDVPPSDGTYGGGSGLIDCYIINCGGGVLGYASPELAVSGGAPSDYTGYYHVTYNTTYNLRRITSVHEYMHITQFGYYAGSACTWFMENCAVMGEEWVYDNLNDYLGYTAGFFYSPWRKLHQFDGQTEYGTVVWPMYLTEKYGDTIVEEIWDEMQWTTNIWEAFDTILPNYGTTLEEAVTELMRWSFYTGSRNDGNHFEEGGIISHQLQPDQQIYQYPDTNVQPHFTKKPQSLGTSCFRVTPQVGSTDNLVQLDYYGNDKTSAVEVIQVAAGGGSYTEYVMTLDGSYDGTIEIPNFDNTEYLFLMVSMSRYGATGQDFYVDAETSMGTSDVDDLNMGDLVRIHPNAPNPFAFSTNIRYSIPKRSDVEIKVIDATGRVVRDLYQNNLYAGDYDVSWNGKDNSGNSVSNGVYFAHIVVGGEKMVREMTVIR